MSGRISIDNLSDSLKEIIANSGMTEEQIIELLENEEVIDSLKTDSKSIVGAINELFQSANNGKELIADAIGEPLSSEDTFSAMSNDINELLSTFKTNMMNNGITVESSDRFKQLIDKLRGNVVFDATTDIMNLMGFRPIENEDYSSSWAVTSGAKLDYPSFPGLEDNYLTIIRNSDAAESWNNVGAYSNIRFDLTNYDKIRIKIDVKNTNFEIGFMNVDTYITSIINNSYPAKLETINLGLNDSTIDVSNLSGEYNLVIRFSREIAVNTEFATLKYIELMTEDGNKGIKFATGSYTPTGATEYATIPWDLDFNPTYIFAHCTSTNYNYSNMCYTNGLVSNINNLDSYFYTGSNQGQVTFSIHAFDTSTLTIRCASTSHTGGKAYINSSVPITWYAIGVGEEDTTLRDSLADILGDKGIDVTEEDDMASLITKVEGIEQGSRYPKWYTHPGNVISTDKKISVECYNSSAIACGTNIYCMGGYSGPYGSYHTMNNCYNTVDNTITSKTPLPGERARMALSSIDKFIYCMGGRDSAGNISVNHIYDTELNTFSDGTSTPFVGSTQNVSAVYNRKIHFIKSGSHSCYDPDLNAWTTKNPATFSVFYAVVSGVIKDKIYILPHHSSTEYVREYDPALNTWTNKAKVSVNGTYGAGGVIDDRLYYAAAYEAYTNINYYDPMTDSFNAPMQFSSRQTSRAAATLNGCLYLFGGCRNNDSSYRTSVIDIYVR